MRRNTTQIPKNSLRHAKQPKRRTYIKTSQQFVGGVEKYKFHHYNEFTMSGFVVKQFIEQCLMTRLQQQLKKREMRSIIRETMKQCDKFLKCENWQISPSGPLIQGNNYLALLPDQEPKVIACNPILGLDKNRVLNQNKMQVQNTISASGKQADSGSEKGLCLFKFTGTGRNSARSNKSSASRDGTCNFSKPIPLRLQTQHTPETSSKRSLQDFLRDIKLNKQQAQPLEHRFRFTTNQKQNLRTIKQFQRTAAYFNKVKSTEHDSRKMPKLLSKEDLATDYDGGSIIMRKLPKLKKTTEILKAAYKVNGQSNSLAKSKNQLIKLKPIGIRKQSINLTLFTNRVNTEDDIKSVLQQILITNGAAFRQLNQKEGFLGLQSEAKQNLNQDKVKNSQKNFQIKGQIIIQGRQTIRKKLQFI